MKSLLTNSLLEFWCKDGNLSEVTDFYTSRNPDNAYCHPNGKLIEIAFKNKHFDLAKFLIENDGEYTDNALVDCYLSDLYYANRYDLIPWFYQNTTMLCLDVDVDQIWKVLDEYSPILSYSFQLTILKHGSKNLKHALITSKKINIRQEPPKPKPFLLEIVDFT
jgi:hypothetical protein